jgi:hypothetical protein
MSRLKDRRIPLSAFVGRRRPQTLITLLEPIYGMKLKSMCHPAYFSLDQTLSTYEVSRHPESSEEKRAPSSCQCETWAREFIDEPLFGHRLCAEGYISNVP